MRIPHFASAPAWLALFVGLSSLGCEKKGDAGPDKATVSAKKEEVPEDFVLNPMLPEQGGKAAGTVRGADGGIDPALMGGGDPGAVAPPSTELVIVEPGAEPRVEQKYAFAIGKTETRIGTVGMEVVGAGADKQQPPLKITLAVTPQKKEGDKIVFNLKATKFEVIATNEADKPLAAQATQQLGAAAGLSAMLQVSSNGETGEVAFGAPQGPGARIAQQLLPMLEPLIEVLFPPLPKQPIGVGAKWKQTTVQEQSGMKITVISNFELTAVDKDTLTVKAAITRKAPKSPIGEPPGATLEVDGSGTYEWTIKKTHAATKAKGESSTTVKQSIPGKGEQSQTIKTNDVLESAI